MISTKRIKIVLPLVIAIFLLTLVAGCGSKTPTDSANVNAPAEKQESGDKSLAELFAKTGEIKGMSFDCISTLPGGINMTNKMWIEGENMRMESQVPETGENVIYIANEAEKAMYLYQPQQKMATKLPYDDEDGQFSNPLDEQEEVDEENAVYVGKEKIDGKNCLVYEMTAEDAKSKMWVWEDNGMPLRIESESEGEKVVVEYSNVKVGDIDDNMFKLPAGTQIMDMANMQGIPGMPAMPQP